MLSELIIPKKRNVELTLDHKQLYEIGLKHAQQLSNRVWTDYNVHDPGITILETLCYAITDLGYRSSFPAKDLLASAKNNADNMASQFFTARSIFPNRPLTHPDYRKLLIDLDGVKNAWLSPHSLTYYADTVLGKLLSTDPGLEGIDAVNIGGIYDITLEYTEDITTSDQKDAVKAAVVKQLQANRNLCEDFAGIKEIENQPFNLCCDLELEPSADVSAVKAEIFYQVQNYLCPSVRFYSLSQMLERKHPNGAAYSSDEIFDGPSLASGFIDDDELENTELRTSIRLSDIISLIMDIKGVQAVRDILLIPSSDDPSSPPVPPANKWVVEVESGKKPTLTLDFLDDNYNFLNFYKRNMPVFAKLTDVLTALSALQALNPVKPDAGSADDFEIPLGSYRDPSAYYSFQNDFPSIYGLSEAGLDSTASGQRKALAYQLKAYLLFYDQVMADYFSQLSHLKDLFSTDPDIDKTYYYQVVDSYTDFSKIYKPTGSDVLSMLENDTEDQSVHSDRRNRFLDHLIARFAERFNDFANIIHTALGASPESIARYKCDFLASYPQVSSERSLAYNYSLDEIPELWDSLNVSGLERRLAKLLGIPNFMRRNLSDFNFTIYAEIDGNPTDEFRFRIRNSHTGKIILSSSTHYVTEADARAEMRRAIRTAMMPEGYQRKKTIDNRYYFNIKDATGEVIARRIEYFASEELMNKAIEEVILYLQENFSDEGMFLIENILLRPEEEDDPFLPICKAEEQTSCADSDPYTYRIHVILPAENGRFTNMAFRRFVEEVIREETPAHIMPKICWISKEDMAMLEKTYKDWIYLKSGKDTSERKNKLNAFIKALFEVKNTYPSQLLRECRDEEDRFVLGQTSIGSLENEKV